LDSRPATPARDRQCEVLCPGCKGLFPSLFSLSCHRNNIHKRKTACGRSLLGERPGRQRLSLRPCQEIGAAADDSDWTDPDIREMMDPGHGHNVPAGAGRGEALPSRDRVSVHPVHPVSRARAGLALIMDTVW
jgi:hypothetical protein